MTQTKIERLVSFLKQAASKNSPVTRKTIERRFRKDPSYVVYFNGLRRNGAVTDENRVLTQKIPGALSRFRKTNRKHQAEYYQRLEG